MVIGHLGRIVSNFSSKLCRLCCSVHPMKPPNILVNTPCVDRFAKQKQVLDLHLPDDTYTLYHLAHEQLCKRAWLDACELLVCECGPSLKEDAAEVIERFVSKHNGKLILHSNNCNQLSSTSLKQKYSEDWIIGLRKLQVNEPCVVTNMMVLQENLLDVSHEYLRHVLQNLGIHTGDPKYEDLRADPVHFYSTDKDIGFGDVFDFHSTQPLSVSGDNLKLVFVENFPYEQEQKEQDDETLVLNVVCGENLKSGLHPQSPKSEFDWNMYKSALKTKHYGHQLLYRTVLSSTQDLLTRLRSPAINTDGFVVTAARQTKGRGRGGNTWLSPPGCLMFSIRLTIPIRSPLGQQLACVQHLIVVALVKSIRESPGYEDIALHIKWPNDVYANGTTKIGGVIVNSSTRGDDFIAIIGFGVNVDNEKPTLCVNSVIREYNITNGTKLQELGLELVLAGTLNHLEVLVERFQTHGVGQFKEEYYRYWLHSRAKVVLEMMDNADAVVVGIDDFGYLQVELGKGETVSLQPDGNTFDLMKNLISIKNK